MKKKLLLAIALTAVASCAAAFGVGCSKPNSADNAPKHNYGEWVIDREATCKEVGRKYHVCTDEGCNVMEWEVIPKMAHKNDIINRTNAGHSFTCSVCSTTTEIETHNFENGICTGCSCYEGDNFDFAFRLSGDESYYVIENFSDKNATDIVIPSTYNGKPVKAIGIETFKNFTSLKNITIPDSVTSIGWGAFYGCSGLTSIAIPDSVTSIESSAFYGCSGLTSITIPDSVTSIESSAFYGCSGLIQKENGVSYVDKWVIDCDSLVTEVTLRSDTMRIADSAFNGCSGLTSITIPDSVTSIGWGAFYGCSGLTSITIPDSVTSIGWGAFYGCSGLTSATFENTTGWLAGIVHNNIIEGGYLTTDELSDTLQAAKYLTNDYCQFPWTNSKIYENNN